MKFNFSKQTLGNEIKFSTERDQKSILARNDDKFKEKFNESFKPIKIKQTFTDEILIF